MNWITGVSKTRVIGRRVPRSVSREEPNITSLLLSLIRVLRGMFFVFTLQPVTENVRDLSIHTKLGFFHVTCFDGKFKTFKTLL